MRYASVLILNNCSFGFCNQLCNLNTFYNLVKFSNNSSVLQNKKIKQ